MFCILLLQKHENRLSSFISLYGGGGGCAAPGVSSARPPASSTPGCGAAARCEKCPGRGRHQHARPPGKSLLRGPRGWLNVASGRGSDATCLPEYTPHYIKAPSRCDILALNKQLYKCIMISR